MSGDASRVSEGHDDGGFQGILSRPRFYLMFTSLISKRGSSERFVRDHVRPFSGCRILDIGCGPGWTIPRLPKTIGEYVGCDLNPSYIKYASRRWTNRQKYKFHCARVESLKEADQGLFDIVLASSLLHHLADNPAKNLARLAYACLKPTGRFVTIDGVYVPNQNRFSKWIISKDRGRCIRTPEEYLEIVRPLFSNVSTSLVNDLLRVPYDHLIMECKKD